jgi:hypothetical protein
MTTKALFCTCEVPSFDCEHDAGCRRCGLPVDFTPRVGYAVPVTEAQRLTCEALREFDESSLREPVTATVATYGTTGCVLLVLSPDNNPAPNPVVRVWADGDAHIVATDNDYRRWLDILGDRVEAVEREDDAAFVIAPGGEHVPLDRAADLMARLASYSTVSYRRAP